MRHRAILALLVLVLSAAMVSAEVSSNGSPNGSPPLIVDSDWVAARLGRVVVIDVGRSASDYSAAHIPGAARFDPVSIYDTVNGTPGMFPGVERAAAAFEQAGVSNGSTVVLYDAANSLWAARAFWALEYLGHNDVHVLNGGLRKWIADGKAVSNAPASPSRGRLVPSVRADRLATKEQVLAASASSSSSASACIVDARTIAEYAGTDLRAKRGGHIPGALSIDWQLNTTGGQDALILDGQELAEMYEARGVSKDRAVVTLCQTGVRGAHTYLVLRDLGYTDVSLYDGSWAEWGNDDSTPIAAGS